MRIFVVRGCAWCGDGDGAAGGRVMGRNSGRGGLWGWEGVEMKIGEMDDADVRGGLLGGRDVCRGF